MREVIETARKVTGHAIPAVTKSTPRGRSGTVNCLKSKARDILKWKPEHDSLEDIIETAWKWHKKHPQDMPGEAKEEYNDLYGY